MKPISNKPVGKKTTFGFAIAAMLAIAAPFVGSWEGKENDPYIDIVGVLTVCFGETRVEMRRYTDAECDLMLREALGDTGIQVLNRNPELLDKPIIWGMATSLTHNIGIGRVATKKRRGLGYRGSSVARRFSEGRWREGCDAFLMWNKGRVRGKLRVIKGLVNRRKDERATCLSGIK